MASPPTLDPLLAYLGVNVWNVMFNEIKRWHDAVLICNMTSSLPVLPPKQLSLPLHSQCSKSTEVGGSHVRFKLNTAAG